MLTSSSDTNYVPNDHEDINQYGSFRLASEIMPFLKLSCKFGELK